MSAVWLLAGLALLGVTGVRTVAAIRPGSATAWVVGAYVVAYAELLVVAIALSLFRAFTVVPLLLSLGAIALASVVVTRGKARIAWPDWRQLARDPVIVVLAIVVLVGLAYTFALSVGVPQVEDDALTFHLQRAALWRQHHGITYLHGLFDFRTNAYPPDGELGFLTSLTLARTDRFAGLPQLFGCLAMVAGTAGIARRIGLDRRQALFGGLLVATLPLIALQAGAAMSDVTVASFLLAAAMFLLDDADAAPWLAGIATVFELLDSGALGKPTLVKQSEKHDGPHAPHFWDVERSGGGVMMDMGCHGIEFFRWMLNRPKVKSVYAQMSTNVHGDKTRGEDNAILILEFEGGVTALAEESWTKMGGMDDRAEVHGSQGVAYADLLHGNAIETYSAGGYDYAVEKAGSTRGWSFTIYEEAWEDREGPAWGETQAAGDRRRRPGGAGGDLRGLRVGTRGTEGRAALREQGPEAHRPLVGAGGAVGRPWRVKGGSVAKSSASWRWPRRPAATPGSTVGASPAGTAPAARSRRRSRAIRRDSSPPASTRRSSAWPS